jgi:hypothetical protein
MRLLKLMKEFTVLQGRTKKVIIFLISIILAIEIILTMLSQTLIYKSDLMASFERQDDALRIVTIGESTTDENAYDPIISWPSQLESLLEKAGHNIQIINLAQAASNSSIQAQRLIDHLDNIKPHLVISMIGINDSIVWLGGHKWYMRIRTVKLFFWIRDYLAYIVRSRSKNEIFEKNSDYYVILKDLEGKNNQDGIRFVDQIALSYPRFFVDRKKAAQFYYELAFDIYSIYNKERSHFDLIFHLFKKSTEQQFYLNEVAFERFVHAISLMEDYDLCYETAQKFLKTNHFLNNLGLTSFAECAEKKPDTDFWNQVFSRNIWRLNFVMTENTILKSYERIFNELEKRNIQLMAMQYPTLSMEILGIREQLSAKTNNIIFISNEDNFKEALEVFDYSDLFIDRFGGTFGHSTNKGNSIIADSVFQAITKWIETKNE